MKSYGLVSMWECTINPLSISLNHLIIISSYYHLIIELIIPTAVLHSHPLSSVTRLTQRW